MPGVVPLRGANGPVARLIATLADYELAVDGEWGLRGRHRGWHMPLLKTPVHELCVML